MSTPIRHVIWATAALWVSLSGAANAGGSAADWLSCRAVADSMARLACFDAAAQAASDGQKAVVAQSFGLPPDTVLQKVTPAVTPPTESRAQVNGVRGGAAGRLIFDLDNGQVWEQVMATADALVEPGQAVTIKSGSLGSFMMSTASGRSYKVRRIR
jgi:hypothetical protein